MAATSGEIQEHMPAHVQIVFKQLFDELTSMKQQQWAITNYSVLMLAGAYALGDKLGFNLVLFIAWTTSLVASAILLRLQWNMGRYRRRIDGLHRAYFTDQGLSRIGVTEADRIAVGEKSQLEQAVRGVEFVSALIAVLIVGSSVVSLACGQ